MLIHSKKKLEHFSFSHSCSMAQAITIQVSTSTSDVSTRLLENYFLKLINSLILILFEARMSKITIV